MLSNPWEVERLLNKGVTIFFPPPSLSLSLKYKYIFSNVIKEIKKLF